MSSRSSCPGALIPIWRWLIVISFLATGCANTPKPVATSKRMEATQTKLPPTPTQLITPTNETLNCPTQPALEPTASPAAVPAQVMVSADGLVQDRILPSPYMVPTYVRAPIAWARSTGNSMTIAVTHNHDEDLTLVKLIAPDAQVEPLTVDRQLNVDGTPLLDILNQKDIRLLAIIEPSDFDPLILKETVTALNHAGVTVFINGDLNDGSEERDLVNELEASGAITVGRLKYGGRIQSRDLYHRQINLFAPYGGDEATFDRGAVLTVAAVAALVLASQPELDPVGLKKQLIDASDLMYTGVNPVTSQMSSAAMIIDPITGDFSPTASAFQFRRVNAARAMGLHLAETWPVNAMNVPAAWETATGRGVKVGVLDGGFHTANPILKNQIVDMFPMQYFDGEQHFHGTKMAQALLSVAPEASLVLLHEKEAEDPEELARSEVQAIDYAIQQGVRVITSSDKSKPNTPEMHAAIDRAIAAGIVFVWSDYSGPNDAVIRPAYFRSPAWEVGTFTFFLDEDRPAELEGGLSFAAPQIAGIAALILQNEPELTPMQVKQRILETATVLPNGGNIADAAAAVENRPSGRQLTGQSVPAEADGKLYLTYQSPEDKDRTVIEFKESHQNWPIASWPRQDILLYRTVPSISGPAAFRLVASQDFKPALIIEWSGEKWVSGDWLAKLTLLPGGEWQTFYSMELGTQDVPPLHVEVICDRVKLSWTSAEGVRMERGEPQSNHTQHSDVRLLNFEVEAFIMPDLSEPIY